MKLNVHKRNVDLLMVLTARRMTAAAERIGQKTDKVIASVPLLKRISDKAKAFDAKMTEKHGHVYTKIRDSIKNTARTVLAYQLFGIPGLVGMCAYKTGEKMYSLLKPAYEAKKRGETKSILSYFKQNKQESAFTLTSASLSIASASCTAAGVPAAVDAIRVGKASLLAYPEMKHVFKSFNRWMKGKESFKEVERDAAVLGITVATYFAGPEGVPMTRGKGKPLVAPKKAKPAETEKSEKPDIPVEKKQKIGAIIAALKQNAK